MMMLYRVVSFYMYLPVLKTIVYLLLTHNIMSAASENTTTTTTTSNINTVSISSAESFLIFSRFKRMNE
jgi:hypothetical protein